MLSNTTTRALAIFTAVATTAAFANWIAEDGEGPADQGTEANVLTDSDGNEYTLTQNDDGSETAAYDDGRTVTFKREDDGNLSVLSGSASLLAGLAAGYYLFHGLSNGRGGYYNAKTHRYTTFDPVQPVKDKEDQYSSSSGSHSSSSKRKTERVSTSTGSTKSTAKSSTSSSSKSGFGSAGARSSSS